MKEMWIARDEDGSLYLFIGGKPDKYINAWWQNPMVQEMLIIDRNLFPEVQWSDEEPTKVKIVIDK